MTIVQIVLSIIFLAMLIIGYVGKLSRERIISEDNGSSAERRIEREMAKRHLEEENESINSEMGLD